MFWLATLTLERCQWSDTLENTVKSTRISFLGTGYALPTLRISITKRWKKHLVSLWSDERENGVLSVSIVVLSSELTRNFLVSLLNTMKNYYRCRNYLGQRCSWITTISSIITSGVRQNGLSFKGKSKLIILKSSSTLFRCTCRVT